MVYYYRAHFGSSFLSQKLSLASIPHTHLQRTLLDVLMTTCPLCRATYRVNEVYEGKINCAICFDDTDVPKKINRLACKHEFCSECCRGWVRRGRSMTPPPTTTDPRSQTPPPRPRTYTPPPGPSRRRNRIPSSSPDPFARS
jgi:hypothetical protein